MKTVFYPPSGGSYLEVNLFEMSPCKDLLPIISNIFKAYPVLPVYGEINIILACILSKSTFYSPNKMNKDFKYVPRRSSFLNSNKEKETETDQIDVSEPQPKFTNYSKLNDEDDVKPFCINHLYSKAKKEATVYLPLLVSLQENLHHSNSSKNGTKDTILFPYDQDIENVQIVLIGLSLLTKWATCIREWTCRKQAFPMSTEEAIREYKAKVTSKTLLYECIYRYNITEMEMSSLARFISLVKSLSACISRLEEETHIAISIRCGVRKMIEKAVFTTGSNVIAKCNELSQSGKMEKYQSVTRHFLALQSVLNSFNRNNSQSVERDDRSEIDRDKTTGNTPISIYSLTASQWCILKAYFCLSLSSLELNCFMLQEEAPQPFYSSKSLERMKNIITEDECLQLLDIYHLLSALPSIFSLKKTTSTIEDLSYMWCRELYLNYTQQVQFPIELSLPWLILEHIITKEHNDGSFLFNSNLVDFNQITSKLKKDQSRMSILGMKRLSTKITPVKSRSSIRINPLSESKAGEGLSKIQEDSIQEDSEYTTGKFTRRATIKNFFSDQGKGEKENRNGAISNADNKVALTLSIKEIEEWISRPWLYELFYIIDIYNDAAKSALYSFYCRWLYDEIEAEVNLIFDQLAYLIGEEIYSQTKQEAASIYVDTEFRYILEKIKGIPRKSTLLPNINRRYLVEEQYHLPVLGRSVDLHYLLMQHINKKLFQDIESVIKKTATLESITMVIEIDTYLLVLEKTHDLLTSRCRGNILLDTWETLLRAANHNSANSFNHHSKLSSNLFQLMVQDLIPNFVYNIWTKRFVRQSNADSSDQKTTLAYGNPTSPTGDSTFNTINGQGMAERGDHYQKTTSLAPTTSKLGTLILGSRCSKMLEVYFRILRGYFGEEHIHALLHLISDSIPLTIDLLYSYTKDKYLDLKDIFDALGEALMFDPNKINRESYGEDVLGARNNTVTAFEDLKDSLQDVIKFDGLKPEIFHSFRECGNIIAFVFNFADLLDSQEVRKQHWIDQDVQNTNKEALQEIFNFLNTKRDGGNHFKVDTFEVCKALLQEKRKLCQRTNEHIGSCNSSCGILQRIANMICHEANFKSFESPILYDVNYSLSPDENYSRSTPNINNSHPLEEFYRVYSNLCFLFNLESANHYEFGHGIFVVGTFILACLNQHRRFIVQDINERLLRMHSNQEISRQLSESKEINQISTAGGKKDSYYNSNDKSDVDSESIVERVSRKLLTEFLACSRAMQDIHRVLNCQFTARGLFSKYEECIELKISPPSFSVINHSRLKSSPSEIDQKYTFNSQHDELEPSEAPRLPSSCCFFNTNSTFHQCILPSPPERRAVKPKGNKLPVAYTEADPKNRFNSKKSNQNQDSRVTKSVHFLENDITIDI